MQKVTICPLSCDKSRHQSTTAPQRGPQRVIPSQGLFIKPIFSDPTFSSRRASDKFQGHHIYLSVTLFVTFDCYFCRNTTIQKHCCRHPENSKFRPLTTQLFESTREIYVKEIGRPTWFNVVKESTSVVFLTEYAERSIEYDLKNWKTSKLKNDHKIIWCTTDNFVLLMSEHTKTSKVLRTPRSYCSSQLRNAWRGKSGQSNRRFSSKVSWGGLFPEESSVEQPMRKRHSDKSSDKKIKKDTNDFQTERRTQIVRPFPDRSELQISQEANWKKNSRRIRWTASFQ